jgi:chromosome partitioning protein
MNNTSSNLSNNNNPDDDIYYKNKDNNFLGKVIAIANQKGGVGKTITSINLSAYLSHYGYKTILIDLDPQGNSTSGLGITLKDVSTSIYPLIIYGEDPNKALLKTKYKNLKLIPSSMQLAGAEVELVTVFKRELRLKEVLQRLDEPYDYLLIDCPPSLGLLTINAFAATKDIIIPIQCGYFSLEGVAQLLNTVDLVKRNINPKLEVEGVLLTMYTRSRLAEGIANEIKNYFKEKLYKSVIPKNVRLDEASSHGEAIISFEPNCKGAKSYNELAKEVILRYQNKISPITLQ